MRVEVGAEVLGAALGNHELYSCRRVQVMGCEAGDVHHSLESPACSCVSITVPTEVEDSGSVAGARFHSQSVFVGRWIATG